MSTLRLRVMRQRNVTRAIQLADSAVVQKFALTPSSAQQQFRKFFISVLQQGILLQSSFAVGFDPEGEKDRPICSFLLIVVLLNFCLIPQSFAELLLDSPEFC